jgi:acyl carrier protein phosphodiesterase
MNFLAHIYLSCDNKDLLIGNFIADFIKNNELSNFSSEVQKGIILHRQIDTYTDAHPLVKKGTRRLQKKHHKYAPVIVDVWYDYLLANNWSRYSSESLDDFCEGVYKILEDRINEFPTKIQQRLPMMIEHKWLQSYGTDEGIRYTFKWLSERLSKPEYLDGVVENLLSFNVELTEEFNLFFPEVIEYVKEICQCD